MLNVHENKYIFYLYIKNRSIELIIILRRKRVWKNMINVIGVSNPIVQTLEGPVAGGCSMFEHS